MDTSEDNMRKTALSAHSVLTGIQEMSGAPSAETGGWRERSKHYLFQKTAPETFCISPRVARRSEDLPQPTCPTIIVSWPVATEGSDGRVLRGA